MGYKLTNYERETIINFNEAEKMASIYTCNKVLIRKLNGFCKKRPDLFKLDEVDLPSKTYIFPKSLVSIRCPKILTEAQKERLRKMGLEFGFKNRH